MNNTTLLDFGAPPNYDSEDIVTSPLYTSEATCDEVVLQNCDIPRTPSPSTPLSNRSTLEDWVWNTKHMNINLGPRLWHLESPSYGLLSKVEGFVTFNGNNEGFERVTASLEGQLTTTVPQTPGRYTSCLFSIGTTLFDSALRSHSGWEGEHRFSLEIPSEVEVQRQMVPTPPSFFCYHYASTCEITYSLRIDMIRMKGKSLRQKNETKSITLFYLPKSSPADPPLTNIPRPSGVGSDATSPLYLHMFDRVETEPLIPHWPFPTKLDNSALLAQFVRSVHFSIPTPKCFASGSSIPFTFSLAFTTQPCLVKILLPSIHVILYKQLLMGNPNRKRTATIGGSPTSQDSDEVLYREWPVSSGTLKYENEYQEGLTLIRGFIEAGDMGKEASWSVDGIAKITYLLRASIYPPKYMQGHIPAFTYDVPVDITTDSWGSVDRELSATGGFPMPALGLVHSARKVNADTQGGWDFGGAL